MKRNEVYETISGVLLAVMAGIAYAQPQKNAAVFFLLPGIIIFLLLTYISYKKISQLSLSLIKCECMLFSLVMMISSLANISLTNILLLLMLLLLITTLREISKA